MSSKIRSEPQSLTHCPLQAEMNLTGARSVQGADLKGCFPSFPLSICKCDKVWPNNSKNVFFHSLFYVDPHKFLDTGDFLISYHLLCLLAIASDTFLSDPQALPGKDPPCLQASSLDLPSPLSFTSFLCISGGRSHKSSQGASQYDKGVKTNL